jgi:hypothetical protein
VTIVIRKGEIFILSDDKYEMSPICIAEFLRDYTPEELMAITLEEKESMGEMPDGSPRAIYYGDDFVRNIAASLLNKGIVRLLNPFEIIFESGRLYKIVRRRMKHDGSDEQDVMKGGDDNAVDSG